MCMRSSRASGTFGSSLRETNNALVSECVRMLVISFSDSSVSMGTAIRPNAVMEKNATDQFGMFCENIATLSPLLMPKLLRVRERRRQVSLNDAYVSVCSPSIKLYAGRFAYLSVE